MLPPQAADVDCGRETKLKHSGLAVVIDLMQYLT